MEGGCGGEARDHRGKVSFGMELHVVCTKYGSRQFTDCKQRSH